MNIATFLLVLVTFQNSPEQNAATYYYLASVQAHESGDRIKISSKAWEMWELSDQEIVSQQEKAHQLLQEYELPLATLRQASRHSRCVWIVGDDPFFYLWALSAEGLSSAHLECRCIGQFSNWHINEEANRIQHVPADVLYVAAAFKLSDSTGF